MDGGLAALDCWGKLCFETALGHWRGDLVTNELSLHNGRFLCACFAVGLKTISRAIAWAQLRGIAGHFTYRPMPKAMLREDGLANLLARDSVALGLVRTCSANCLCWRKSVCKTLTARSLSCTLVAWRTSVVKEATVSGGNSASLAPLVAKASVQWFPQKCLR